MGIFLSKIEILSSFSFPHVVPNLHVFVSSVWNTKAEILNNVLILYLQLNKMVTWASHFKREQNHHKSITQVSSNSHCVPLFQNKPK